MVLSHGVIPFTPKKMVWASGPHKGKRIIPRGVGLNPVEKAQAKDIAIKEDRKRDQVHQKLTMSPAPDATGSTYVNWNYAGIPTPLAQLMRIVPQIAQGDNREQRLGSKINLTSVNMRFFFHIPPSTSSTALNSSYSCRLLVLSPRLITKFTTLQSNWDTGELLNRKYLRNGDQATGFLGDLNSLRYPVNTATMVTHYDKHFTLNRGQRMGDESTGLTNAPDAIKHFNLSLKVKSKNLRFSTPSDVDAENEAYFAILLYAPNNGGNTTSSTGDVWGNCFSEATWRNLA